MSSSDKFEGWVSMNDDDHQKGTMQWQEYTPKNFTDDDVQVSIAQLCSTIPGSYRRATMLR